MRAAIAALLVFLVFLAIGYFTAGGRLELPWRGWGSEAQQTQQIQQGPQATLGEDEFIPRSDPFLAYSFLYDYAYTGNLHALINCSTSAEGALVTVSCSGWANLSYRRSILDAPENFLSYYYREAVAFNTSAGVAKVSIQEYVMSTKGRLVPYGKYEGEHRYRLVALKPESMWVGKLYFSTSVEDRWFEGFKIQVAKLVAEELGNGTFRVTVSPPPEEYVRVAEEAASLWASAIEYFLGRRPQIAVEPLGEQATLEGPVSKLGEELVGQPGLVRILITSNYSFISAFCGRGANGCASIYHRLIVSDTGSVAHEIGHYLGFPHIYLEGSYLPLAAGSLMYGPPGSMPGAAPAEAPRHTLNYLDMATLSYLLLTAKGFHDFEMDRTAIYYACWKGGGSLFFLVPEIEGVDRIFGSWFSYKGVPLTPGLLFMFTYSGVGGAIEAHRLVEALLAGAGGKAYSPYYDDEFVVRPFYGKWEGC